MSAVVAVRAAVAPVNAEPRMGSEQVTQTLAGHWLAVLEERAPWLRVRTGDGYEGWVHGGYTDTLSAERAARVADSAPLPGTTALRADGRRISLGCTVREPGGRKRALPLGALVTDDSEVVLGTALTPAEMAERFPASPEAIACTALERFEGTAYEWGGITPWGADCSGIVQMTFALHGIALPRDAAPQSRQGRDAGTTLEALGAGDLLFFSERADGRITHVGIALGEMRMVHLGLGRGGYSVERLDNLTDPYVAELARHFRGARRIV
jgi:cell wall-associated NlpC family hydrolase